MAEEQVPKVQKVVIPDKEMERAAAAKKIEEKASKWKARSKAVSQKISGSVVTQGPLDFLRKINDWLEKYPTKITEAFDNIVGDGERLLQEKVDVACTWLAWKVNIAVERKRQEILKALYELYQSTVVGQVMKMAGSIKKFFENPVKAIGEFAGAIFRPVAVIFNWVIELAKEVLRLAANLAKIMQTLPPNPPNPQINYDKFKLKVRSISIAEVTTDPSAWPAPEQLFPEPQKPFTKEGFQRVFETASAHLKSATKKYKMSPEDEATLAGFGNYTSQSDLIKEATDGGFDDIDWSIS